MIHVLDGGWRARWGLAVLLAFCLTSLAAHAGPKGNSVPRSPAILPPPLPAGEKIVQGAADFARLGNQLTVTTSDSAQINWSSFNINEGYTTTFIQPSASSIVWNRISDPNPSQILGNLNANGYIILQNPAGFYVGGQAAITAQGLIMTTAPIPVPKLSSGGPWDFGSPPPAAQIVNYGQIQAGNGGSAFLIADLIENHGTITAPEGNIGLYAGKEVLVSERPDGRGLSAKVTLPEGSVNNVGKLIADAGTIAMHAQVVNQGGLVQANSVREVNGVIELVASDAVNLGANSVISAQGDSQGASPGGMVVISADNTYSDTATSKITVAGKGGGKDGIVEIFGSDTDLSTIQSSINGVSAAAYAGTGLLLVNPVDITLSLDATDTSSSSPTLNVQDLSGYSKIDLFANGSITLNTVWTLADSKDPGASLKLQARNNLTLSDDGSGNYSGILAGKNWSLNLVAGAELTAADQKQDGMDRIFLQGMSFLQTQNGSMDLTAGNEVFVDDGTRDDSQAPYDISAKIGNGITTAAGGSISVTARYGDVNTGGNPYAYSYHTAAPYYTISTTPGELGGISTAAGGDVSIWAGGNITSFAQAKGVTSDAGAGAFGAQPGNVSLTAGGGIYGHFVVANGTGTVSAGQNVGAATGRPFALSLIRGGWSVYAPNGSIYLQEVRNPNGDFNSLGGPGNYLFDYDPHASLLLEAANGVEITGAGLPRGKYVAGSTAPPVILPPSLEIIAGSGGIKLDNNVTLFPSAYGELNLATSGNFIGKPLSDGSRPMLLMSDSGANQWIDSHSFAPGDHASSPVELGNLNPAVITVAGSMNNLVVGTDKQTRITVGGDMNNSAFSGQNLAAGDVTSINVLGKIYNRSLYTFTYLTAPIASVDPRNPNQWDSIFNLLVDPKAIQNPTTDQDPSKAATSADLLNIASRVLLLPAAGNSHNPGFVYDPATLRLGFAGVMPQAVRDALKGTLEVLHLGPNGLPVVVNGQFLTDPVTFVPTSAIDTLYTGSQDVPTGTSIAGYKIGGPGRFNIRAGSLDLGTTEGISSVGATENTSLAKVTASGAAINVDVAGDLTMFTSRIVSLFGGDVTVTTGGSMDLGSQDLFGSSTSQNAFGIYTTGHSGVNVTARGDININGSRIASYNGGNVTVESLEGDVNVGSGGTSYVMVPIVQVDAKTGLSSIKSTFIYGSGIETVSLTKDLQTPGGKTGPGDISVTTPQGDINSALAGILQLPLDGNLQPGPVITLKAGTAPSATSAGYGGNIDLGDSGVIGGAVNMTAQGNIHALIISQQNATVNAAQNFSGTLLSAGTANVSAGGTIAGTIAGIAGVSASGGQGITAALMSQNVQVGGQTQSTLGNSAAPSTASQSAAMQANTDSQRQVAQTTDTEDDQKKKQQLLKRPTVTRRVGRVTVILPPA